MKANNVSLLMAGLSLPGHVRGGIRKDLTKQNMNIAQMEGDYKIDFETQEVLFTDRASDFEEAFRCSRHSGKQLTQNEHGTFIGCCKPGQKLLGSPSTAFDCCEPGEHLTGSHAAGFACCPRGQVYDDKGCHYPDPQCKHGKIMVAGACECPAHMREDADGHCRNPPPKCESGVREGLCYILELENGHRLGYSVNGYYALEEDNGSDVFGKFRFCKTEACEGRSAINPSDEFRVRDVHGRPGGGGASPNEWLSNAANGAHIGRTARWEEAGRFSITKWTPGRHCLAGSKSGLGPTRRSVASAMSFTSVDRQVCLPLKLVGVPCDIRASENNCLWNGNATGGYY